MIQYPFLIPECNVDTAFVEALRYKSPNHAPNINEVTKILEKNPKQRAIGFIDNDKRKPKYATEFKEIESASNVQLLKHIKNPHYLVIVNPAMDEFIYNICRDLEIDISKYTLPTELDAFITKTKKQAIKANPGFKNLLNTIVQRRHPTVEQISQWIKKYSPYTN